MRKVIDERRRIDRLGLHRLGNGGVADGIGDGRLVRPAMRDDVAGLASSTGSALQAAEGQDLRDAALFDHLAVRVSACIAWFGLERARTDPAGQDAAEEGVGSKRRHQHAERAFLDDRRLGTWKTIGRRAAPGAFAARRRLGHPAMLGRAIEDREIELLVGGLEGGEEVEHLVQHLVVALVGPVDLVDARRWA